MCYPKRTDKPLFHDLVAQVRCPQPGSVPVFTMMLFNSQTVSITESMPQHAGTSALLNQSSVKPRPPTRILKRRGANPKLVVQCEAHDIPFIEPDQLQLGRLGERADVVLDAIFGFSFKASGHHHPCNDV